MGVAPRDGEAYACRVLLRSSMHGRPAALASIGLALLLAAAQPARADWFSEGVRVAASDTMQSDPVLASDGSGGAYIVWQDYRPGFSTLYAQHLTAEGSTASGWPGEGMQISTGLEYDPVVVADGRWGAFIA